MFDDDRADWDPEPERHTPWEPVAGQFTGAACTSCGAKAGAGCVDFLGRPRARAHDDRLLADLPQEPYDVDDGPAPCNGRWKGQPCTDPAWSKGYCDIHLEKYS